MVKVESGLFSEIKGTLEKSKTTFQTRRSGIVAEKKPIPAYKRTEKQDAVRTKFKNATEKWKTLTEEEKQQLKKEADKFKLTAYQYFIKLFMLQREPEEQIILFDDFDQFPEPPTWDYVYYQGYFYCENSLLLGYYQDSTNPDISLAKFFTPPEQLPVKVENKLKTENTIVWCYLLFSLDPIEYLSFRADFKNFEYYIHLYTTEQQLSATISDVIVEGDTIIFILNSNESTLLVNNTELLTLTYNDISNKSIVAFSYRAYILNIEDEPLTIDYIKLSKP